MKKHGGRRLPGMGILLCAAMVCGLLAAGAGSVFAGEGKTRISVWLYPVGDFANDEVVSELVEDFEAVHPEITVDVEYLDYASGDDQVEAAIANGTTPDVIFEGPERLVNNWGARELMLDVSDLWTEKMKSDLTQDGEAIENACRDENGTYYEYPLCRTPHGMVINYDVFEKAGALKYIDEENRTWTTENFIKACEAIRDSGLVKTPGVIYCGGQGGDQGTRSLVGNLCSADFFNEDHTKYTINSEKGIRALTTLQDLVSEKALASDANTQAGDEISHFLAGDTAMCFQWNSSNAASKGDGFTPFAMTFPTDEGEPRLWGGIWGFGIFRSEDEKRIEASKKLISFMCDDPTEAKKSVAATGQFPVRESLGDVYAGTHEEEIHKPYAQMMDKIAWYNAAPVRWIAQRTAWWCMLQQVFYGGDVEDALGKYDHIVNETGEAIVRKAPEIKQGSGKNVLFLSSYSESYPVVDDELSGIESALDEDTYLYKEYMDSATINDQDYISAFYQYLNTKYSRVHDIDAVIVDGDVALSMLIRHQNGVFSATPIIYTDIKSQQLITLAEAMGMTGVTSGNTISSNLNLALSINSNAERILAITDNSLPGQALEAYLKGIKTRYTQKVEILDTSEHTRQDILKTVSAADNRTIILYMLFSSDQDGNAYRYDQSVKLVSGTASVPVYTTSWMGNGSLGSICIDFWQVGNAAGNMARTYISGQTSSDVDRQISVEQTSTFDEAVMKKYKVTKSSLPAGARIVNRDEKQMSRLMIYCLLGALAASIAIFVWFYRKEKKRNREQEEKLRKEEAALKAEVFVDELTGIGNRRFFNQVLSGYIKNRRHVALILADVDNFEDINDRCGHLSGDIVLRSIAQQLVTISSDTLEVFRYRGDEFAILYSVKSTSRIDDVVMALRNLLQMNINVENGVIPVSMSMGVASFPENAADAAELFKRADASLREAKTSR